MDHLTLLGLSYSAEGEIKTKSSDYKVLVGGGGYYTELHYFTLHFWLFLCMV